MPDDSERLIQNSSETGADGISLKQFCGLAPWQILPMVFVLVVKILLVLAGVWNREYFQTYFQNPRDRTEYAIFATASSSALVTIGLCWRVMHCPTLHAMQEGLENGGVWWQLGRLIDGMAWISPVLSLLPILYALNELVSILQNPGTGRNEIRGNSFCWAVGGGSWCLMFVYLLIVFLCVPMSVCTHAIKRVVSKIDESKIADLDWDRLRAEVCVLQGQLQDLWSPWGVGAQWALVIFTDAALVMWAAEQIIQIMAGSDAKLEVAMVALFGCMSVLASLLYALASVNTLCQSPIVFGGVAESPGASGPPSRSILGAALRFMTRGDDNGGFWVAAMTEEQKHAHQRFVTYLSSTTMGAPLCGIVVTYAWLVSAAGQLAVVLPLAYQFLLSESLEHPPE